MELDAILKHFKLSGQVSSVTPYGSGHIHDSYKVVTSSNTYLLQRVNTHVFPKVDLVMENIENVILHLKGKGATTFELTRTSSNELYHKQDRSSCWRVLTFIENSKVVDRVESEEQAHEIGCGFGAFLRQCSDLEVQKFHVTIPNFHNIPYRLHQLKKAINTASAERLKRSEPLLKTIDGLSPEMQKLEELRTGGAIPVRVTHNDTKCNNVLLDLNDEALCAIDLDTVMPGIVHYDFGDALRTVASTADEDEADLSKVSVNEGFYQSFSEGYVSEVEGLLTTTERNSLHQSPAAMAFIMGVRFLADYLEGDRYFKTKHADHNFHRAANQLKLALAFKKLN